MKTVLLTGFAGFIGSQILRDLLKLGFEVIGIDNLSEGSDPENFKELTGQFKMIVADISDPKLFDVLRSDKIDYIINCAAQSHVDRSFNQVDSFIKSNINGPINMATIAIKKEVEKFVQVSTDEVFSDSEQPFTEMSFITPQNAYSTSKASAEMFLKNYERAFGLPLVITNGANTYGLRQNPEKVIPKTIQKIMACEKVPLFKTPAQRMWLHVEDHSIGIIKAMLFGKVGQRYCLAPDIINELFTEDLIKEICKIMKKDFNSSVEYVEDRPNYDLRYYMLNDKAKEELKWSPKYNILKELKKIISGYTLKY